MPGTAGTYISPLFWLPADLLGRLPCTCSACPFPVSNTAACVPTSGGMVVVALLYHLHFCMLLVPLPCWPCHDTWVFDPCMSISACTSYRCYEVQCKHDDGCRCRILLGPSQLDGTLLGWCPYLYVSVTTLPPRHVSTRQITTSFLIVQITGRKSQQHHI